MLPWLFVFFVLAGARAVEVGDECTTPADKAGECRRLQDCPSLLSKLERAPLPSADKTFMTDSKKVCPMAPSRNNPGVCCEHDVWTNDPHCGIVASNKLFGGVETYIGEFPWMVLLGYNETESRIDFNCGGSLINRRWVLTAAHCITNNLSTVRLGEHDLTASPDCEQRDDKEYCHPEPLDVSVLRTVKHPEYTRNVVDNDIALIQLDSPVQYRGEIKPVCLPVGDSGKFNLEHEVMVVAGWGRTEERGSQGSPVLMKLYVPVTTNAACDAAYPTKTPGTNSISSKLICVGDGQLPRGSCNVDSGGPLTMSTPMHGRRRWAQFAVASSGKDKCGSPAMPALHTRVSQFMRWINSVVDG